MMHDLEHQGFEPTHLVSDGLLFNSLAAELALLVVLADQVQEDGTRFPNGEVLVLVVYESGDSSVGVHLQELALDTLLLVISENKRDDLVAQAKLLEQDGYLEWVWAWAKMTAERTNE